VAATPPEHVVIDSMLSSTQVERLRWNPASVGEVVRPLTDVIERAGVSFDKATRPSRDARRRSSLFPFNHLRLDDDPFNAVHKLERAVAVLDRLRRFAPAAIEDGIGGGDPGQPGLRWSIASHRPTR